MINFIIFNLSIFLLLTYHCFKVLNIIKINLPQIIIIFIFEVIITTFINMTLFSIVGTLLINICYLVYTFLLFEDQIFKKIFLCFFPFIIILSVSEIITVNLLNILAKANISNIINSYIFFLGILLFSNIAFLLIYIFQSFYSVYKNIPLSIYSWHILMLPISTILLIYNIKDYDSLFRNSPMIYLTIIFLLISNFISIDVFLKSIQVANLKKDYKILKAKEAATSAKYDFLNVQYINSFRFMHDTRSKLLELNHNFENKDFNKLKSNLSDANIYVLSAMNLLNTNSDIINSVIKRHLNKLNLLNIKMKTVIEYNDFSFMSKIEQNNFFNDLLNNTLDYFQSMDDDSNQNLILLKSKKITNKIIVKLIINKSENDNFQENDFVDSMNSLENTYNIKVSILTNIHTYNVLIIFSNTV